MNTKYILEVARINSWARVKKFSTQSRTYLVPQMSRSGVLNTGLTPEEEADFEKRMGFSKGTLAKDSKYWETFVIVMKGDKHEFDGTVADELAIKVLKAHKRVADGFEGLTPSHDYVLYNIESEAISKNLANKIMFEAMAEIRKLTSAQMINAAASLGLGSNATAEIAEFKLTEYAMANPQDFLARWVNNPNKEVEVLLSEAISANVIRKDGSVYFYGTDTIGVNKESAISYLNDKKHSDVRKAVSSAIASKSKLAA